MTWTSVALQQANSTFVRLVKWMYERSWQALELDMSFLSSNTKPDGAFCLDHTGNVFPHLALGNEQYLHAINVTKDSIVAGRVTLATTRADRRRGLLNRSYLASDEGLYITPAQWMHMFGMRFPIDVAFLSSSGRVLFVHHGLKPNRFSRPVWRAEGALVLPAGTLLASRTEIGDTIELRVPSSQSKSRWVF